MKYVVLCRYIILFCIIFIISTGCNYFEVYKKTGYVNNLTAVIKNQQEKVDSYITLTSQNSAETPPEEELKKNFQEIKDAFTQNKKELEVITPPKDYVDEHDNFIKAFQNCIDAVDASIAILDIKDDKSKAEKIGETKNKIEEYKKLVKAGINSISVDLR
ncbi:MAG TPA: hypothetical protein PL110_02475 [Candidatus Eremiobacteraeota bacterium]|nr:MAG: hypothetical protein BWY64_01113 [bacterium ADurb.Bin363]HPZ06953.1 hypothetical protein [Candidatus Eremiobacteraeota bacterium]